MSISSQLKTQTSYWAKVVVLGLIIGLGMQFVFAWTSPTVAPAGGNVTAPITVGAASQTKTGALGVGSLTVAGKAVSASTVAGDGGTTMVTKNYLDAQVAAATAAAAAGGGVLPGTICGSVNTYGSLVVGWPNIPCNGVPVMSGCPAGYYFAQTAGSPGDLYYYGCIKS